MKIKYPAVGICGLSCRLCPRYHTDAKSRCPGCKSGWRMAACCPFITCAVKKKGIEFCWDCTENKTCEKWKKHRKAGKTSDSFKCYQKLEADIIFIQKNGVIKFEKSQKIREKLLKKLLVSYDDGRSKSCYCIAATVLDIKEIKEAISAADKGSVNMGIKERSALMRFITGKIAEKRRYCLRYRNKK
jgi:hypothetical protein